MRATPYKLQDGSRFVNGFPKVVWKTMGDAEDDWGPFPSLEVSGGV